ncbi:MAG: hypothetical protein JO224_00540 [Pelomonas sp.]|nr:hypothetical protein [Roseateles sp.]
MSALTQILAATPLWVWAILGYIVYMGGAQLRERAFARRRLILLPGVWMVFGAWGIERSFALGAAPLVVWGVGLALSFALMRTSRWPAGARFDASLGQYLVPGSALPLALMLVIFVAKYALGVGLALHPELGEALPAALGFSLLFGLIGGALAGRSANILAKA